MPRRHRQVIEIGPGQGALTELLLTRADRVVALEMDPGLAEHLRQRWPDLYLVEGNALNFDWNQWGPPHLPAISRTTSRPRSSRSILRIPERSTQAVFLIQKEVAERITAKPGTRDFGYLSVECQYLANVEYLFSVPPGAFRPPPKVDSAVIRLTPRPEAQCDETKPFLEFASACFRQKRKTLRNNLSELYPKEQLEAVPAHSKRAEQLSVAELLELFRQLSLSLSDLSR